MNAEDLKRLADEINGRISVQCPKCRTWRRLSLEMRGLRFGTSPNLSEIDPSQPGRPRLQFFCTSCSRMIGFVTADAPGEEPESTRWEHLEI